MKKDLDNLKSSEVAKLLDCMKPGDILKREKEGWTFQRYQGNHWIDVTKETVEKALSLIQRE